MLINADTDQVIGELSQGDSLDFEMLGTMNLNVRADVAGLVGSVVFAFDGDSAYRTESSAPYALGGDSSGDYAAWTPSLGQHTVSVTAYSASGGSGSAVGEALSVSFTVVDTGTGGGSAGTGGGSGTGGSPGTGGSGSGGCDGAQFEEKNGIVVIDMESIAPATGWNELTSFGGYLGDSYFEWRGPASNNSPGNGLLEYKVKINTAGKYGFMWRAMVGMGTNTSEHNDSFLRFPEVAACKVYGEKGATKKYANGCGTCGTIVSGTSKDCWYKIYGHALDWAWKADTSDNDARNIFVEFDAPGVYTIQVSGRSQYHRVDRMVLYNTATSSLSAATGGAETLCD